MSRLTQHLTNNSFNQGLTRMTPTTEQSHILSRTIISEDNLLIHALAGTGKTSTLEMIEQSISGPILSLAFNKRIAEEMAKRFKTTTTVRTFNSLGHRIWAKTCASSISFNPKKTTQLLSEQIKSMPKAHQSAAREVFWDVINAVGVAKSIGYIPEGVFPQRHPPRFYDRFSQCS